MVMKGLDSVQTRHHGFPRHLKGVDFGMKSEDSKGAMDAADVVGELCV
jgi:hypothetical protein